MSLSMIKTVQAYNTWLNMEETDGKFKQSIYAGFRF